MAGEEETIEGRVVAYSHIYNGAAVTATKVFFADGTELVVEGHLQFPPLATYGIRFIRKPKGPATFKGIELLAG